MPWWLFLIIIAAVIIIGILWLRNRGKKIQKQQAEQQEQLDAAKQTISLLVIDKKLARIKDSGLPPEVEKGMPRLARLRKFPIVKGKVGPRILSFITEKKVFEQIPVKKEIKADISGLYIVGIKNVRGGTVSQTGKKKESKFEELLKKGRGEA